MWKLGSLYSCGWRSVNVAQGANWMKPYFWHTQKKLPMTRSETENYKFCTAERAENTNSLPRYNWGISGLKQLNWENSKTSVFIDVGLSLQCTDPLARVEAEPVDDSADGCGCSDHTHLAAALRTGTHPPRRVRQPTGQKPHHGKTIYCLKNIKLSPLLAT